MGIVTYEVVRNHPTLGREHCHHRFCDAALLLFTRRVLRLGTNPECFEGDVSW